MESCIWQYSRMAWNSGCKSLCLWQDASTPTTLTVPPWFLVRWSSSWVIFEKWWYHEKQQFFWLRSKWCWFSRRKVSTRRQICLHALNGRCLKWRCSSSTAHCNCSAPNSSAHSAKRLSSTAKKWPHHLAVQQLQYCNVLDVQNSIQYCWFHPTQCSVAALQSCSIRILYHPAHQKVTTPSLAVLQYCQLWSRGFNHRNGSARSRIGFSSNVDDDDYLQNLFRLFYDDILLGSSKINIWNCDGMWW